MSSCNACKKTVRQSEKVVCTRSGCNRLYHYLCVGLPSDSIKNSNTWVCPVCISKRPRADNSNTPVKSTVEEIPITDDDDGAFVTLRKTNPSVSEQPQEYSAELRSDILSSLKADLHNIMRSAVKSELSSIKTKMSTMESTLNYISTQYDDLIKSLASTTAELKCVKEENARLRSDVEANSGRIKHLEEENARQQQWSRLQNIEITGVPESKDEDTVGIVVTLAKKIGIKLEVGEVEFAHRIQARRPSSSAGGRCIIARLRHRSTKDSIVAASRKHRGVRPADLGLTRTENGNAIIYINEHLSKNNRTLLKECKLKAKEANFKYVWSKNCRIYVRRNDTSPPIPIITSGDLIKIV